MYITKNSVLFHIFTIYYTFFCVFYFDGRQYQVFFLSTAIQFIDTEYEYIENDVLGTSALDDVHCSDNALPLYLTKQFDKTYCGKKSARRQKTYLPFDQSIMLN